MAKRTYEERKDELSKKQITYLEKANNLKEQIKELEKKQAEENRRKRNHRLIEVGAAVESVLGRAIEKDDIPKLIGFLNKQEQNGKYFSTAMGVKETNVNSNK